MRAFFRIPPSSAAAGCPVANEIPPHARNATLVVDALLGTGIAGPAGGTKHKPAGTVFIALAGPFGTTVERRLNAYQRARFKQVTARQALALLRAHL